MNFKHLLAFYTLGLLAIFLLHGCGDHNEENITTTSNSSITTIPGPSTTIVGSVGALGPLADLGELNVLLGGDPTVSFLNTRGTAINDSDVIVGQGNFTALPTLGAFAEAYIFDVNADIVTPLGQHVLRFPLGGPSGPITDGSGNPYYAGPYSDYYMLDATTPEDWLIYSEAVDINNSGKVIGNSTTGFGWPNETSKRAFYYDPDIFGFVDLPPTSYLDNYGKRIFKEFSEAVAINDNGIVILTADDEKGRHAYYCDTTIPFVVLSIDDLVDESSAPVPEFYVPSYHMLGKIIGANSEAIDINNHNQAIINSGETAIWHDIDSDAIEVLNYLPNATTTTAYDINNADPGNVVGKSGNLGFFWQANVMNSVGHLGGGTSEALVLNDSNQVAGNSTTATGATHAFFWQTVGGVGVMNDLGTLGGTNSYALAINNAGMVLGYSDTGEFYSNGGITMPVQRAFLWKDNVMYNLGTIADFYTYVPPLLDPYPVSKAVAINNAAIPRVVGNSFTINNSPRSWSVEPVFP